MSSSTSKSVPGFEGKYQINIDTPQGRCMSYKNGKVRELSNKPDKRYGRIYWTLCKDGKCYRFQAARWIALTFPELVESEYFPGAEIDHIDTDRNNNHPSNLRWVTRKENCNNPLTLTHYKEAHVNHPSLSRGIKQYTLEDEFVAEYPSIHEAGRVTGVNFRNISMCYKGERKSAGGFIWK